jgi:hypothetical protein
MPTPTSGDSDTDKPRQPPRSSERGVAVVLRLIEPLPELLPEHLRDACTQPLRLSQRRQPNVVLAPKVPLRSQAHETKPAMPVEAPACFRSRTGALERPQLAPAAATEGGTAPP